MLNIAPSFRRRPGLIKCNIIPAPLAFRHKSLPFNLETQAF